MKCHVNLYNNRPTHTHTHARHCVRSARRASVRHGATAQRHSYGISQGILPSLPMPMPLQTAAMRQTGFLCLLLMSMSQQVAEATGKKKHRDPGSATGDGSQSGVRRQFIWRRGRLRSPPTDVSPSGGHGARFGSPNGILRFPRARGSTCARVIVSVTRCRLLKHMTELYGLYDHSGV